MSLPRDPQPLADGVLRGDVRAVARAITLVENGHADKSALLRALFAVTAGDDTRLDRIDLDLAAGGMRGMRIWGSGGLHRAGFS